MLGKQYLQAGVLVVFAVLAAGCGEPGSPRQPPAPLEHPVETASAETRESLVEEEASPVRENHGNTVAGMTTAISPTLEYSPAWVEYQEVSSYDDSNDVLESIRITINYMSNNPNDNSISMGALCWAFHELIRSSMMSLTRWLLDDNLIPYEMEKYGVTSEQIGSPGPEATEAFLNLVSGETGSVESVDDGTSGQTTLPAENGKAGPVGSTGAGGISEEEYWESVRLDHEFAGDGTAWSDAVRVVASSEMAEAFRAGEGLPPDVQVYADALVAFARERVGKELNPSAESEDLYFEDPSFPGLASFMEAAKYHQDCKRAAIVDIPGTDEEGDSPPDDSGGSGLFDEGGGLEIDHAG